MPMFALKTPPPGPQSLDDAFARAQAILAKTFGYRSFRSHQESAIRAILGGGDAFVLMPTGGGKSLCYQIPALLRPGVGIVVSPLIALMQDQVDALRQLGVRAAFLNPQRPEQPGSSSVRAGSSTCSTSRRNVSSSRACWTCCRRSISPVRDRRGALRFAMGPRFPSRISPAAHLADFPGVPRIALTATADEGTRAEIIRDFAREVDARRKLRPSQHPLPYRRDGSVGARKRLWRFIARTCRQRRHRLLPVPQKDRGNGRLALRKGRTALAYHAGMTAEERARPSSASSPRTAW